MMTLKPHRVWIGLFGFAALLYFGATPLMNYGQRAEAQHTKEISAARAGVEKSLRQLEDDITAAQKLGNQMSRDDVEHLLAPVDRLQVATMLEHQAAMSRLQHFTYTMAPEEKTLAGGQNLAQSDITLAADAPIDTDAYAFVENARRLLPGRAQLRALTVERIGNDAPLAGTNVRMTARFEWLSNGASKTLVGGL